MTGGLEPADAARLGGDLIAAGLRPMPNHSHDGDLLGIRLWRLSDRYIEYLDLQPNGYGHAIRAIASWHPHRPFEHGPLLDHYGGAAANALDWLCTHPPIRPSPDHISNTPLDRKIVVPQRKREVQHEHNGRIALSASTG